MRSAFGISLALHLAISLIALEWVSFREVRYVPRTVYNVTLVTAEAQAEPGRQVKAVEPARVPPEAEPEPEPEEEMAPPPEKPKPRPRPSEKKPETRTVPTTELEKTREEPEEGAGVGAQGGAGETGHVSFDTGDFPFAPYINRMRRKIAASWRVPEGSQGADRFCRVYFRVHTDGSVSDVMVEESSGLFMFDQSAQRAVLQSSPLPPLPREYDEAYLGVHFSFAYREAQ